MNFSNQIFVECITAIDLCKTAAQANEVAGKIRERMKTVTFTVAQYNAFMKAFKTAGFNDIIIPKPLPVNLTKWDESDEDSYQDAVHREVAKLKK